MLVQERAAAIRLLIIDIDGVLTSGLIYYGSNQLEIKAFHVHDGLGLKLIQKSGIQVGVITAKKSEAVTRRLNDLGIEHAYCGYEDKRPAYEDIKKRLQLSDEEIAYMGDDLPDLPILMRVHLALTVPQAHELVKQHAHYITKKNAGNGAVREACELIMKAQLTYDHLIKTYLHSPS